MAIVINTSGRVIIAGSREGIPEELVYDRLNAAVSVDRLQIKEVVCGDARGVDTYGARWAAAQHIPVKHFPAKWDEHGRSAGYRRNVEMAEYADYLIAFWDGASHGTRHMIDIMKEKGKHGKVILCQK